MIDEDDEWVDIDLSEADHNLTEEEVRELEEAVAPPPPAKKKLSRAHLQLIRQRRVMNLDELYAQPSIEWFIEDLLPLVPRTMIQGSGGSFKSFLVLDWMLCAATGRAWFGRPVRPGTVLYMAGEGARGMPKRIDAWCAHNHTEREGVKGHIDFMGDPFNFGTMKDSDKDIWRSFVESARYDYVVIDTLHTTTSGLDENSNSDMGKVLDTATYIVGGSAGAQLIFVHHKGHNSTHARGASALRDDFDATCNLDRPNKDELVAKLTKDKIRDIEEFKPLYLKFVQHQPHDRLHSSLFIEEVTDTGREDEKQKSSRRTAVDDAVDAMREHDMLATGWGAKRVAEELKKLDLGYNFAERTVGRALRTLRQIQDEVENMQRRREAQEDDDGSDD